MAEPQESGLNERRFHLDSALGKRIAATSHRVTQPRCQFLGEVTHRGSNESFRTSPRWGNIGNSEMDSNLRCQPTGPEFENVRGGR